MQNAKASYKSQLSSQPTITIRSRTKVWKMTIRNRKHRIQDLGEQVITIMQGRKINLFMFQLHWFARLKSPKHKNYSSPTVKSTSELSKMDLNLVLPNT